MRPCSVFARLLALLPSGVFVLPVVGANTAQTVVDYVPGPGAAIGYDQPSAALGEPSRVTPGEFGGPVDPFNAPWQAGQLVSLGAGGSLTLRFAEPVQNLATHPFGIDFLVFGSSAFLITNGDFTGGGITDGSLFGQNTGASRVSVSADGVTYYRLDSTLAPTLDLWFPTDGSGDFAQPVDPRLGAADFAGLDLTGIRSRYAGSGGGAGFDLDWARDESGTPVALSEIQFVRLEVLADRAEIDAVVAVPEPSIPSLVVLGLAIASRRQTGSRRS